MPISFSSLSGGGGGGLTDDGAEIVASFNASSANGAKNEFDLLAGKYAISYAGDSAGSVIDVFYLNGTTTLDPAVTLSSGQTKTINVAQDSLGLATTGGTGNIVVKKWTPGLAATVTKNVGFVSRTLATNLNDGRVSIASDGNGTVVVTKGRKLEVAYSGSTYSTIEVSYDNGQTWTEITISGTANQHYVAYGNGIFVLLAGNGQVSTSADGIAWTALANTSMTSSSKSVSGLVFSNGYFIAGVYGNDTTTIYNSPDGTTWTGRHSPYGYSNRTPTVFEANGYAVYMTSYQTDFWFSADGGFNWSNGGGIQSQYSTTYAKSLGYAGGRWHVLHSDNGGWQNYNYRTGAAPNGVNTWSTNLSPNINRYATFVDVDGEGFIFYKNSATYIKGSGSSWTQYTLPVAISPIEAKVIDASGTILVVGQNQTGLSYQTISATLS